MTNAPHKKVGIDWSTETRLGELPDAELARLLGVAQQTVFRARKRRGIALSAAARTRARDLVAQQAAAAGRKGGKARWVSASSNNEGG